MASGPATPSSKRLGRIGLTAKAPPARKEGLAKPEPKRPPPVDKRGTGRAGGQPAPEGKNHAILAAPPPAQYTAVDFRPGDADRRRHHTIGAAAPFAPTAVALAGHAALNEVVLGKNLWQELGGRPPLAANARHAQKIAESSQVIGLVERLPGRIRSLTSLSPKEGFRLYEHSFPHPDEQEPVEDIVARLAQFGQGPLEDGSHFHAHCVTNKEGVVIAYSQGSTVPCDEGLFFFWQYGCVADAAYMKSEYGIDQNPREHGVLNTLHGINAATLAVAAERLEQPALDIVWESEPRGLGDTKEAIQFTDKRLSIHNRAGGRVMMGMTADGELVNLHLQPRLKADSEPIALHFMHRPLTYAEGEENTVGALPMKAGASMMSAWLRNFEVEGTNPADVHAAAVEMEKRLARCVKIVLLPADQVPDVVTLAKTDPILEKQVHEAYGTRTLDEARAFYDKNMRG